MHLLFRQEGPLGGTKVALVSVIIFFQDWKMTLQEVNYFIPTTL